MALKTVEAQRAYAQLFQGWTIGEDGRWQYQSKEGQSMDTQKVLIALCDRLGLTIDHKFELVEINPKKPWGGDSLTSTNFAKVREDLDDMQEIVMGLAKFLHVDVTVEDGRKVTVTPPEVETDDPKPAQPRTRSKRDRDPF